jgi:hypothetical protein
MPKTIPEPSVTITPPTYSISDSTAGIKAQRLMAELKGHTNQKNWHMNNRKLGLKPGMSKTKKWKAILDLPNRRRDIFGFWLNDAGQFMDQPNPKRTAAVTIYMLSTLTPDRIGGEKNKDSKECLCFSEQPLPGRPYTTLKMRTGMISGLSIT